MDTAVALDAIAGHEPGERHHAPAPPTSFADAARVGARAAPGRAVPRGAVRHPGRRGAGRGGRNRGRRDARGARPRGRGGDVPAWDDESFADRAGRRSRAAPCQHLVRVHRAAARPAGRPEQLEPATRAWLVDSPPIPLVDYLEAAERLWAFGGRLQAGWATNEVLLTPTLTRLPAAVGGHAVAGRRHRRRRPLQRARADLERDRASPRSACRWPRRRPASRSASSSSARTAATTCSWAPRRSSRTRSAGSRPAASRRPRRPSP